MPRYDAGPMGAHIHGHRLFGNVQVFRGFKAYWDCHRDALFRSSIQAHLTRISPKPPLPKALGSQYCSQIVLARLLSAMFFLVHGFVRLHHEFAECNGSLGIEPHHSNTQG